MAAAVLPAQQHHDVLLCFMRRVVENEGATVKRAPATRRYAVPRPRLALTRVGMRPTGGPPLPPPAMACAILLSLQCRSSSSSSSSSSPMLLSLSAANANSSSSLACGPGWVPPQPRAHRPSRCRGRRVVVRVDDDCRDSRPKDHRPAATAKARTRASSSRHRHLSPSLLSRCLHHSARIA